MNIRDRINTLSKRMDILDNFRKKRNNSMTCDKWKRYFRLKHIVSTEYATLIRL